MKARGTTRKIIVTVEQIQTLIERAEGAIDTKSQYEIRNYLEEALKKCHEIRNLYDPVE